MRVVLSLTEEVPTPFTEDFLRTIAQKTCEAAGLSGLLAKKEVSVNAAAVASEKIRTLNGEYRDKDAVTDILSFGEFENTAILKKSTEKEVFLGDLVFCNDYILRAAEEDAVTAEHEMAYIFSHGVLHLLGFDHGDEMFRIQDEVTLAMIGKTKKKD